MDDIDSMYLDNIDEFVNDENRIVTYIWLSRTLSVHVNQSKQMLYSFVQFQRNKKDNDKLHVLYLVAGLSKPETDQIQRHRVIVTAEENLEAVKQSLGVLTSCHIYSVHNTCIKDSNVLVQADYDTKKVQNFSHLSAISCPAAVARSAPELPQVSHKQDTDSDQKTLNKSNKDSVSNSNKSNDSSKSSKSSGLKAMFAAGAQKSQDKTKKESPAVTTHKKKDDKSTKPQNSAKSGNVISFFSNHATKSKDQKTTSVKQEKIEKTQEKSEDKSSSPENQSLEKGSRKKKANRSSDEDENPVPDHQKKRRRIRAAVVDSSDDEQAASDEEMDVEVENPIPDTAVPSPPPSPDVAVPSPPPSPRSLPQSQQNDSQWEDTSKPTNGSVVQIKNGRRRRRRLVPKTSIDEDGFMVTEKVWESESTDASEDESNKKKQEQPKTDTKTKEKPIVEKKQVSPVKTKPKQASLMSFFKKK